MIDPAIRAFVDESERFYPPDAASRPLVAQRELYDAYATAFAVRRPASVVSRDASIGLGDRCLALRHYRSARASGDAGLLLYAHGGGFILGSLASHDGIVARIAEETGADVVAINYRLAPEHPAPAALDDICAVIEAARRGGLPWPDLAPARPALMGDSAGAALMASAALRIGRAYPGAVAALALVYPALGYEPAEPARSTESDAAMLTLADVHFYRSIYLADQPPPPLTFVLDEADLSALPPTVLLPAEHDPLRDDCTVLHARLRAFGIDTMLLPGTGLVHGALRALDHAPAIAEPISAMLGFVTAHLDQARRK